MKYVLLQIAINDFRVITTFQKVTDNQFKNFNNSHEKVTDNQFENFNNPQLDMLEFL